MEMVKQVEQEAAAVVVVVVVVVVVMQQRRKKIAGTHTWTRGVVARLRSAMNSRKPLQRL